MDKMDEQVLVFPACYQKHLVGLPGFVSHQKEPGNWGAFIKEIFPGLRFMRRGDVEDDPSINQVIPYVVIRSSTGRVLVYNRGDKGGEERLVDKWSIGIGGHINKEDGEEDIFEPQLIFNAASREIREELLGTTGGVMSPTLQILGCLYLTDTPVDAVHFGLVMGTECLSPELIEPTEEATQLRWVKPEKLKEYELENWSAIVRDELLLKEE